MIEAAVTGLRRRLRRLLPDEGAAVVEFALILPLLTMLTMGILDGALTMYTANAVTFAAQEGVRAAADQPGDDFADYYALKATEVMYASIAAGDVQRIVIYRATPDSDGDGNPLDNPPPAACLKGSTGVAGVCNVYLTNDLKASKTTYGSAEKYLFWRGNTRDIWPDANDVDYVGVYVAVHFRPPTGILGGERTISKYIVARLEPQQTAPVT